MRKTTVRLAAAGSVVVMALAAAAVGWRASRALRLSTEEVRSERQIRFLARPLELPKDVNFEAVKAPAVFLQAARFQDHLYIASPAGLFEYDSNGVPLRQFAVGRDLPSSPLLAAAPAVLADAHEPILVVATAQDGLLEFNGRSFRQIYPEDAEVRAITAILPVAAGHLLIGTKKRGVLLYDGKQITALHATLSGLYVQALAGNESDLWVGTLDRGVLHWHAGATESFGEEQGLPDRQVQAIATSQDIRGDGAWRGGIRRRKVFPNTRSRCSSYLTASRPGQLDRRLGGSRCPIHTAGWPTTECQFGRRSRTFGSTASVRVRRLGLCPDPESTVSNDREGIWLAAGVAAGTSGAERQEYLGAGGGQQRAHLGWLL
jgi:hypothetical protein